MSLLLGAGVPFQTRWRAHLPVCVFRHAGARPREVLTQMASHVSGRGGDVPGVSSLVSSAAQAAVCEGFRFAFGGRRAERRAIPFAVLTARLCVDLARKDSPASVLLGKGPVTYVAGAVAFVMDDTGCERRRAVFGNGFVG